MYSYVYSAYWQSVSTLRLSVYLHCYSTLHIQYRDELRYFGRIFLNYVSSNSFLRRIILLLKFNFLYARKDEYDDLEPNVQNNLIWERLIIISCISVVTLHKCKREHHERPWRRCLRIRRRKRGDEDEKTTTTTTAMAVV